jgi:hypothetical protein
MINEYTLGLYKNLESLEVIGGKVGRHPQALRKDLISAGLAIKKRDRLESLAAYYARRKSKVEDDGLNHTVILHTQETQETKRPLMIKLFSSKEPYRKLEMS